MQSRTIKIFGLSLAALIIVVSLAFILGGPSLVKMVSTLTASIGRLLTKTVDFNAGSSDEPIQDRPKTVINGGSVDGGLDQSQSGTSGEINLGNTSAVHDQAKEKTSTDNRTNNNVGSNDQSSKTNTVVGGTKGESVSWQSSTAEKSVKQESVIRQEETQKIIEQQYQKKLQDQLEQQRLSEEQRKQQETQRQKNLKAAIDQLKKFFLQRLEEYNSRLNALDNRLASKESEINLLNKAYNLKVETARSQTASMASIIEQENQLIQERNEKLIPLQSELGFLKDQRDKLIRSLIITDSHIYSINDDKYEFIPSINGDGGYLTDPFGNYYRVIYYPSGSFVVSL